MSGQAGILGGEWKKRRGKRGKSPIGASVATAPLVLR